MLSPGRGFELSRSPRGRRPGWPVLPVLSAALLVAGLLAGCGGGADSTTVKSPPAAVATVSQQGVRVELRWTPASALKGTLAATFSPLRKGFHLYSAQLPATGIEGVGRPTRLEVGGRLVATAQATADRAVTSLHIAGVDAPVPVYPDGPVTLWLPVQLSGAGPNQVWLSYAACSSSTCLPPVTRLPVTLTLP